MQTSFHTLKFLQTHFVNASGMVAFLAAYRCPAPYATVQKWWQRHSIPSEWLPVILALIELDNGEPVRLAGFLGGESEA